MRATGIVYTLIGMIVLLPWLVYNLKIFLDRRKSRKKPSIGRILSLVLVSVLILTAVYSHYRFTAGYQAPLVAERAGQLFTRRVEGKLDLP
jgi:4-amino-4-deoxy-L-arabinose transferase-like glycosyltransferase